MSTAYGVRKYSGAAAPTTITGAISTSSASFSIASGTSWPTDNFFAVIDEGTAIEEKVFVGLRTGTALSSVLRGEDGPAAQAHASGATIRHIFVAQDAAEANAVASAQTTKGDLIGRGASAGPLRLGVGADGTVLTASAAAASGWAWSTPVLGTIGVHALGTTYTTTGTHTTMQAEGLTLTRSQPAGRRWKFTVIVNPIVSGGANGVKYQLYDATGGTILREWTIPTEALSTTVANALTLTHTATGLALGSTVFQVRIAALGANTAVQSAADRLLLIEDIGT